MICYMVHIKNYQAMVSHESVRYFILVWVLKEVLEWCWTYMKNLIPATHFKI